MDAKDIVVIKRDGVQEKYDIKKIVKICEALGLSETQQDSLVKNVDNKIKAIAKNSIQSNQIRDLVAIELKKIDEQYADEFDWFYKMNKAEGK
jgi:transcriptional regulator NrdR family protein